MFLINFSVLFLKDKKRKNEDDVGEKKFNGMRNYDFFLFFVRGLVQGEFFLA